MTLVDCLGEIREAWIESNQATHEDEPTEYLYLRTSDRGVVRATATNDGIRELLETLPEGADDPVEADPAYEVREVLGQEDWVGEISIEATAGEDVSITIDESDKPQPGEYINREDPAEW